MQTYDSNRSQAYLELGRMSKCILEEVELERCLAIIPMQLMIFNMPWYLNQPTKWHPPLPKD
ncbi:hypothetical protein Ahy_A05g022231 isoform A [Arachis hypogaea]|uniref:Uncharacterized protein n=1 Tax=Arachis hypogaea TaxID=3818 RepID=A0A445D014_ARAHY|nr:hypothetical protein Ahy_A05g022231 isoform A [Arachis hypogaea]